MAGVYDGKDLWKRYFEPGVKKVGVMDGNTNSADESGMRRV